MTRTRTWLAAALVLVLMLVGIVRQRDARPYSPTTYGTFPGGYRVLYDGLAALGFDVRRSEVADAPPTATLWWIDVGVCRARDDDTPWPGLAFARGGGTAVALLGAIPVRERGRGLQRCRLGEGIEVALHAVRPGDGTGPLSPAPRRIGGTQARAFKRTPQWRPVWGFGRKPFVIERPLGDGRLVLVADDWPFANDALEDGDHALLAVDLARAYGSPVFDEAAALRFTRGTLAYLARSPAAGVFLGLALLASLAAWHGQLVPARTLPDGADPTPRLDDFVASLATLYARTGDHARVFIRYRQSAVAALRRRFALAPDVPAEHVVARARRLRPEAAARFDLLEHGRPVADERALRGAVAEIDRLLEEVCA